MQILSRLVTGMFNQQTKVSARLIGSMAGPADQPSVGRHMAWLKQTLLHNEQTWLELYRAMDTAG